MNIHIVPHNKLSKINNEKDYWHDWPLVLISSPRYDMSELTKGHNEHLYLKFEDITDLDAPTGPKEQDIIDIMEFTKDKERVIFSCQAGISRSSAAALIALCQKMPITEAVEKLDLAWHHPNQLMVYHASKILKDISIYEIYLDVFRF